MKKHLLLLISILVFSSSIYAQTSFDKISEASGIDPQDIFLKNNDQVEVFIGGHTGISPHPVFPLLDDKLLQSESGSLFLVYFIQQMRAVFDIYGADAVRRLLAVYIEKNENFIETINSKVEEHASAQYIEVEHRIHPHYIYSNFDESKPLGEQIEHLSKRKQSALGELNRTLENLEISIRFSAIPDDSLPNPFEAEKTEGRKWTERIRYVVGPGVALVGGLTDLGTLVGYKLVGIAYSVLMEAQFANAWINNHIWARFIGRTKLGGVLLLNVMYGALWFGCGAAYCKITDQAIDDTTVGHWTTAGFKTIVNAGLFTASYGIWQYNKIRQRFLGMISENHRYFAELFYLVPANIARIVSWVYPTWYLFGPWNPLGREGASIGVGPGELSLFAMALFFTLPDSIKTYLGPRAQEQALKALQESRRSSSNEGRFRNSCKQVLGKLANPWTLRRQ